jgi:hypothetical protein
MKKASIRVILIFIIAIFMSLIPEQLPDFFGDWSCNGCNYAEAGFQQIHAPKTHWGYRHWLFFFMGLVLFIMQSADIVVESQKKLNN